MERGLSELSPHGKEKGWGGGGKGRNPDSTNNPGKKAAKTIGICSWEEPLYSPRAMAVAKGGERKARKTFLQGTGEATAKGKGLVPGKEKVTQPWIRPGSPFGTKKSPIHRHKGTGQKQVKNEQNSIPLVRV